MSTLLVTLLLSSCIGRETSVTLPAILNDSMVLQRGEEMPIWGKAEPRAKVLVVWQGRRYSTKADEDGCFTLTLPACEAGGPYTLKVGDKTLEDVLVGDVLLCSGQSNMELPIRRCLDKVAEDIKGYSNPMVRYTKLPLSFPFDGPADDLRSCKWEALDSDETALGWGALAYYLGRYLEEETGVPIGIINSSQGGTPIESWLRESSLPGDKLQRLHNLQDTSFVRSMMAERRAETAAWENNFKESPEPKADWKPCDIFSSRWAQDSKGINWNGLHHFRHSVKLSADEAKGPATIHLGAIIDSDSVFVNSHFVGTTGYRYPPRHYAIPEGTLREGNNLIEVSLYAYGTLGGSFVPDKRYSLETSTRDISLLEGWEHSYGKRAPVRPDFPFIYYEPACLYNGMIAPLRKLHFCAAVWYQGESNIDNASEYGTLLEELVKSWREEFSAPELPFYIVELGNYEHNELSADKDSGWNRIQKEQRATCERLDEVYFVPNADLGEWNDIHPQDKKTLGDRVTKLILNTR